LLETTKGLTQRNITIALFIHSWRFAPSGFSRAATVAPVEEEAPAVPLEKEDSPSIDWLLVDRPPPPLQTMIPVLLYAKALRRVSLLNEALGQGE
jgi:hypothetical protein